MQNVNDMIKQNEDYVLEQICTKYFLKRSNLSPHGIEKKNNVHEISDRCISILKLDT